MALKAGVLALLVLTALLSAMAEDMHVERQTTEGRVRGTILRSLGKIVDEYRGIPFAEPPVGIFRFRPPQPKAPWEGTLDATAGTTACPQVHFPGIGMEDLNVTEDCLHLNVWLPELARNPGSRRPVLVWIHGGGFTLGSANQANYSGAVLAAFADVVVVSMNYRLSILGFLNGNSPDAPGNVGLLDQVMALKWVQRNIEFFGGDPQQVTLFGESAGSWSVHAHIMSPMSEGLFKRALLMSGTMYSIDVWDTVHESMVKGDKVAGIVGCSEGGIIDLSSTPEAVIACLRNKSTEQLVTASAEIVAPKFMPFYPTYHDVFLPRNPIEAMKRGFFAPVDVMAGVTSDEGACFLLHPPVHDLLAEDLLSVSSNGVADSLEAYLSRLWKQDTPDLRRMYLDQVPQGDNNALRRQYVDFASDRVFNCPLRFFADTHSERGGKVFAYVFAHKSATVALPHWMGQPHGSDIPFVFGKTYAAEPASEDGRMSEAFMRMVATFAENGVPELPNNQQWPPYTRSSPTMVVMGHDTFNETQEFRASHCERWRPLF
ncbi:acetylcholinesterase [Dermacentor silvarum]|uniref:acetylcholinesterase n=1 Tax=Dermacentor silvarum TaxID=543639 RepID=UPI001897C0E2|nr:acetylcholinesterase [Dermacentor silvarum]